MANETVQSLRVQVIIDAVVTGNDGQSITVHEVYDQSFSDGTGNYQVGAVFSDDTRPLNTTNETIILGGASATVSALGVTMTDVVNCKMLYFRELGTTAGQTLTVGGGDWAAANGPLVDSTDKMVCGPGGIILMVNPIDGYTITATTKDGMLVATSGNQNYRLIAAGDNT